MVVCKCNRAWFASCLPLGVGSTGRLFILCFTVGGKLWVVKFLFTSGKNSRFFTVELFGNAEQLVTLLFRGKVCIYLTKKVKHKYINREKSKVGDILNCSLQFFKKTIHLLVFFSRNCQFTFNTMFESKHIVPPWRILTLHFSFDANCFSNPVEIDQFNRVGCEAVRA